MVYYVGEIPITPYLEHHGIIGMKWGRRRYQNDDGTLTEAGKTRYKVASRSERITLENLKKIQSDTNRMKFMDKRQKARLKSDIDFYEKRTKGEVKKKNFISRYFDNERSTPLYQRALKYGGTKLVAQSVIKIMGREGNISVGKIASDIGSSVVPSIIYAAKNVAISEVYNRAVGRY